MDRLSLSDQCFDLVLTGEQELSRAGIRNLAELLFRPLLHRDEQSEIILGHDGPRLVRLSLSRLRFISARLFAEFRTKGIRPEDTVLLASVPGNSELFLALLFNALAAYGVRTLLPMFMETALLEEWLDLCRCSAAIIPERDIDSLDHHEKEKSIVRSIKEKVLGRGLPCFDSLGDSRIREWLYHEFNEANETASYGPEVDRAIKDSDLETEALLISTSGSSGKSKLALYKQGAFIRSCLSWQKAGFYEPGLLGGRGFTPLFCHTMGIRAFFNALWTGSPVCLINTEWFEEKPETVRYFLLQMRPEHITGGPAVYQLLLELMRNFPELKNQLRSSLKTLVLSGAPKNRQTAREVASALGLVLYNAFGMTETQQVLSTLRCENPTEEDLMSLGRPLPGVAVGLRKLPGDPNLYRLYVKSPFGACRILGEAAPQGEFEGFLDTGDVVALGEGQRLLYQGREGRDFFKDGFGVKIPLPSMARHYASLYQQVAHIEYFPLKNSPGLAALIFITGDLAEGGIITNPTIIRRFSRMVAEINSRLFRELEPFEFRHRSIRRLALTGSPVPLTEKGTVSRYKIELEYAEVIEALRNPQASRVGIETIEDEPRCLESFTRFLNPYVGHMLSGLKMDIAYHRAKKDSLFAFEEGREIEVLDLVGGYGSNLLGHNNEELKEAVLSCLAADKNSIAGQGSIQKETGDLAEELAAMVGELTGRDYSVMFASSGSEAVDMALHHATLEWRRKMEKMEQEQFQRFGASAGRELLVIWKENRRILSSVPLQVITLKTAFHGCSAGPRSLLGNDELREVFSNLRGFERIPIDDQSPQWREQLQKVLAESKVRIRKVIAADDGWRIEEDTVSTIIAAIAEPIVGEGGVRKVNRDLLLELSSYDFPLIIDEIQSGLGRSGSFLASEGICGDYYLFGKALGGGLEKISALLVDRTRLQKDFGKYYVSTFANGELAARVARQVLAIIKRDRVPERAAERGGKLLEGLNSVQEKYPEIIAEISGQGLMLGIRLGDFSKSDNIILRVLTGRKVMGYLCSCYLLRKWWVRALPSLSAPNTLRVEPSAYISDEEIQRVVAAVEDLAGQLRGRHLYELFRPLMDGDPFGDNKNRQAWPGLLYPLLDEPAEKATRVAFIAHFSRPADELRLLEKEFSRASDTGLRILFNRLQVVMEMKPIVLFSKNLFGGKIHFTFIVLPVDSAELERLHRLGQTRRITARIQEAVDLAARAGARVIGLGGYASILSRNGLALVEPEGTRLVTGNTLTAASCLYRLAEKIKETWPVGQRLTVGVVGAGGNIGSMIAESMARTGGQLERIILVDRKDNLKALAVRLDRGSLAGTIEMSTDLGPLKDCDVVAVATNTNDPIIFPHHLKKVGPVLVVDVSIPSALSEDVSRLGNVQTLPFASYITLPEDPDFIISSHTPKGAVFCCAAEVMLCGLEDLDVPLRGRISAGAVARVTEKALKHGFFQKLQAAENYWLGG